MVLRHVGVTDSVGVCIFVLDPSHCFPSPMWRNKLRKYDFSEPIPA